MRPRIMPEEATAQSRRWRMWMSDLNNVILQVTVELGRKEFDLGEVLALRLNDVIVLDKLAGEAFDIRVNHRPFAEGEIVVVTDLMAVRITKMLDYSRPPVPTSEPFPVETAMLGAPEQEVIDAELEEGAEEAAAEVLRLEQRIATMREEFATLHGNAEALELEEEWVTLVQRRQELLPLANTHRMVRIPAGSFAMGSRGDDSPNNERPVHTVHLSTYYMSPFPVTNLEYREFVKCTGYRVPGHWRRSTYPTGTARHPVADVSWHDAKAYTEWLGARLPTEAEWEKAARGADERLYPWGSRFMDERCNCNNMTGGTLPVDEFPNGRSPYGIWDMAGNVYEWCEDYYDENYYQNCPATNPKGPASGQERVVRGGSFQENRPAVRTTHRDGAGEDAAREIQGFRIAMDA